MSTETYMQKRITIRFNDGLCADSCPCLVRASRLVAAAAKTESDEVIDLNNHAFCSCFQSLLAYVGNTPTTRKNFRLSECIEAVEAPKAYDIITPRWNHPDDEYVVLVRAIKGLDKARGLRRTQGDIVVHHATRRVVRESTWMWTTEIESDSFAKQCIANDIKVYGDDVTSPRKGRCLAVAPSYPTQGEYSE